VPHTPETKTPPKAANEPSAALAPIRDFYDGRAAAMPDEYETHYWRLYDAITWAALEPLLPKSPNARILDAGGGYGLWTIQMAKACSARVDLVDLSESMLAVAREKIAAEGLDGRVSAAVADLRDLSRYPDGTFDLILCEGDPLSICTMLGFGKECLAELVRVLAPRGKLVFGLDSRPGLLPHALAGSLDAAEELLASGFENVFHEHGTHGFELAELDQVLGAAGLVRRDLLGKPVLHNHLERAEAERRLADPAYFARALELELRFARRSPYRECGEHLQVVAEKA
jgi:SAM-dependent methyltransferase